MSEKTTLKVHLPVSHCAALYIMIPYTISALLQHTVTATNHSSLNVQQLAYSWCEGDYKLYTCTTARTQQITISSLVEKLDKHTGCVRWATHIA